MHTFTFPSGDVVTLTPAQTTALGAVAKRWNLASTVEVHPLPFCDGAVILNVGTMWLAVETDGYVHS